VKLIGIKKDGKKYVARCPECDWPVEQYVEDTVRRLMGEHTLRKHGVRAQFVVND
jgi:hypothetical protein